MKNAWQLVVRWFCFPCGTYDDGGQCKVRISETYYGNVCCDTVN